MRLSLFIFLIGGLTLSCSQQPQTRDHSSDEKTIRIARDSFNKAIADHDTLTIDKLWLSDFLVISSRNSQAEGKEANRKLFVHEFTTKPDVIYVRTPVQIDVMPQWGMASESGTWEGSWTENNSKIQIGGTYYAKWHKDEGKWMLRVEIYTPTHCKGGAYCDALPINT